MKSSTPKLAKTHLRRELRARNERRVSELVPDGDARSRRVCAHLLSSPWVREASALCCYVSWLPDEPDIRCISEWFLEQGRPVFLPRYEPARKGYAMVPVSDVSADVSPGHFEIPEPRRSLAAVESAGHSPSEIWCVPGAAFDRSGNRLGRGGGYYDRLLRGASGRKIGVTYGDGILPSIPSEPHDVPMDAVVSESGWCEKLEHE